MPLTRFTLRQIEAFIAVAEAHSFTVAASRLGLTAQAVSQLIAELETLLGFRLFDRTTRKVALSSAGRDFLGSAATLLRHVRAADSAADDVRNRASGVVRVGAPLVLASTALPMAMRDYQKLKPKVVVRVRDVPVDHPSTVWPRAMWTWRSALTATPARRWRRPRCSTAHGCCGAQPTTR